MSDTKNDNQHGAGDVSDSTVLLDAVRAHLSQMSSHIRARLTARQLSDLHNLCRQIDLGCCWLEGAMGVGAILKEQDGQWHVFRADGEGVCSAPSIFELLAICAYNVESIHPESKPNDHE